MGLFDGTEFERPVLCEQCGEDVKHCDCAPPDASESIAEVEPEKQRLQIRVEKRKRGKWMTVISGFQGSEKQRREVLVDLKNEVGAGGTIVDFQVEIQGDHHARIATKLESLGFRVAGKK